MEERFMRAGRSLVELVGPLTPQEANFLYLVINALGSNHWKATQKTTDAVHLLLQHIIERKGLK